MHLNKCDIFWNQFFNTHSTGNKLLLRHNNYDYYRDRNEEYGKESHMQRKRKTDEKRLISMLLSAQKTQYYLNRNQTENEPSPRQDA